MRWLPLCLVLAGCSQAEAPAPVRPERVELPGPSVDRHAFEHGELLVLKTPQRIGRNLVDVQTCYVWRDSEYRTASMQCPVGDEGGPVEGAPRESQP
jgi:hypothetical protein